MSSIVEHVVLFKLNDVDSGKINSMVNGINELVNLNQVLHLSCGSIHRLSSTTASAFTHVLHSRYRSKEDLNAYAIHPDHLRVVKESESIREDIMAVDWIADQVPETLAPPPGSCVLFPMKEKIGGTSRNKEYLLLLRQIKKEIKLVPLIEKQKF